MSPKRAKITYSPLPANGEEGSTSASISSDENRSLLKEEPTDWLTSNNWSNRRRRVILRHQCCLIIANIILFTTSIFTLLLSIYLFHQAGHSILFLVPPLRNALLKTTSQPSPILDKLNIPLSTKRMNGTLLNDLSNPQTIYRLPPSPEVDAAWDRIQTRNPIAITRSDVLKLNRSPLNAARYPPSYIPKFLSQYPEFSPSSGHSEEAYIAKIDVFHQIHCLNTLRMNLYSNYAYYNPSPNNSFSSPEEQEKEDKWIQAHLSHCIGILLENLMCAANVDIYTHFWMDAQKQPFPDFNIDHKCRDFDAILAWQEEFSVPLEEFAKVTTPPDDAIVHVMSEEFKEVVKFEGEGHHHHGGHGKGQAQNGGEDA